MEQAAMPRLEWLVLSRRRLSRWRSQLALTIDDILFIVFRLCFFATDVLIKRLAQSKYSNHYRLTKSSHILKDLLLATGVAA